MTTEEYGILDVRAGHRTRLLAAFRSNVKHPGLARENNSVFRLRCTMPHSPSRGKDGKHATLCILINGLGESDVTPYDELADDLADRGVPSILLPLPGHYARHPSVSVTETGGHPLSDPYLVSAGNDEERPAVIHSISRSILDSYSQDASIWIHTYRQMMADIQMLLGRLRGVGGQLIPGAFGQNTKISLYGYSLGGLFAICTVLGVSGAIHSCFIINSGSSLHEIDAGDLFSDNWPRIKRDIAAKYDSMQDESSPFLFDKEFKSVFLGANTGDLKDRISQLCRRILFVLGARDTVFRAEDVMRVGNRDTGITFLQLPAIGHYIGSRPKDRVEWTRWRRFLASLLVTFDACHPHDDLLSGLLDEAIAHLSDYAAPGEYLQARLFLYDRSSGSLLGAGSTANIADTWAASFSVKPGQGVVGRMFEAHKAAADPEMGFAIDNVIDNWQSLGLDLEHRQRLEEANITSVAAQLMVIEPRGKNLARSAIGVIAAASNLRIGSSVLGTPAARVELRKKALIIAGHIEMQGGTDSVLHSRKTGQ